MLALALLPCRTFAQVQVAGAELMIGAGREETLGQLTQFEIERRDSGEDLWMILPRGGGEAVGSLLFESDTLSGIGRPWLSDGNRTEFESIAAAIRALRSAIGGGVYGVCDLVLTSESTPLVETERLDFWCSETRVSIITFDFAIGPAQASVWEYFGDLGAR